MYDSNSLGHVSRYGTAESYGNSAFQFCQTLSQSSCTILQSHQQCVWIATSSYPHQHSLLCLFDYSHLNGCEVVSHVVLICISRLVNDVEHLFVYYRPFVYLLWRNIISDPLIIFFYLGCLFIVELQEL